MAAITFGPMTGHALPAALAVNQQYQKMLSPLTLAELRALVAGSCFARQTGGGRAFIIAYDQDGDYESANFKWFADRFERFIYVDRIAIADDLQRKGLARAFYEELFGFAKAQGYAQICAEVNIRPANPASHAFHRAMGFVPWGAAHAEGKELQYYVKEA